jgi:hypothetical protein
MEYQQHSQGFLDMNRSAHKKLQRRKFILHTETVGILRDRDLHRIAGASALDGCHDRPSHEDPACLQIIIE